MANLGVPEDASAAVASRRPPRPWSAALGTTYIHPLVDVTSTRGSHTLTWGLGFRI